MASAFLVSPMNNGLAFKISEGQKGGKGGWPWPQDSVHVSLPGRRNLSCWDGGVLWEDSVVSGLGNQLVCDTNKGDNTEGSEEESIYGKVTHTDPERWNLKYLWANMVEIWEAVLLRERLNKTEVPSVHWVWAPGPHMNSASPKVVAKSVG